MDEFTRHPIDKKHWKNNFGFLLVAGSIKVVPFISLPLIGPGQTQHADMCVSVSELPAADQIHWAVFMLLTAKLQWTEAGAVLYWLVSVFPPQPTVNGWPPWAWTTTTPLCFGTGGRGRSSLPCGEYSHVRLFQRVQVGLFFSAQQLPLLWWTFLLIVWTLKFKYGHLLMRVKLKPLARLTAWLMEERKEGEFSFRLHCCSTATLNPARAWMVRVGLCPWASTVDPCVLWLSWWVWCALYVRFYLQMEAYQ